MQIDPNTKRMILADWESAPYGEKTLAVNKWAELLNCSKRALYNSLSLRNKRSKRSRKIANIEDYVETVFQIKKMPPASMGEISTVRAIRIAIKAGKIPASMRNKVATFDRIARNIGLTKKNRRIQRYQAERPNQLHHVDASSSKCFYIKKELPDGDYVLGLHAGTKGYKNKPTYERLRPWVYGLTDDYSGAFVGQYVAAKGESSADNIKFMSFAWSESNEKIFFGLPEIIKGDLGPMMRSVYFREFLKRLSVENDQSKPLGKEAHGKIERKWRIDWQDFELPYYVHPDWKKFEITLSELNRQFLIFQEEYNNGPHRWEKNISKIDAWRRINLRGGAVAMPENAIRSIARRESRVVGTDGVFSLDNTLYEVKGLHDASVYVYTGVFDNKIVVEDKATGEKYEVEDFKPNPVGTYTGHKETPHQKAVKASKTLDVTNTLYQESEPQGNVKRLPTRVKETREIENPLAIDSYSTIDEAMADFVGICGAWLEDEVREAVRQAIIEHGLSRRFVTDLALDCQVDNERSAINE